ncbi:hypothetical protein BDR26DRAFT_1013826 [Obelidium mucronatum]|nr:hypothetical protein BDR26DRAFT_1013826 [Obelidium mucronatum]
MGVCAGAAVMSFQAVSGAEEVSSFKGAIRFPYAPSRGFQDSLWCQLRHVLQCAPKAEYTRQPMEYMALWVFAAMMSFQAVSGAEETHCGVDSEMLALRGFLVGKSPDYGTWRLLHSMAVCAGAAVMSFQAVSGAEEVSSFKGAIRFPYAPSRGFQDSLWCQLRHVLQCAPKAEYTRQPMESIALWVFAAMRSFQAVSGAEEVSSLKGAIYFPYERSHGFQNSLWCGLQDAGYEGGLCGQVPRNQDYGTWRILHSMAVCAGAAVMSFQAVSGAEETHCGARSDSVLQCAPKEYTRQPMESIALWVFAAMMSFQAVSGAEEMLALRGVFVGNSRKDCEVQPYDAGTLDGGATPSPWRGGEPCSAGGVSCLTWFRDVH